MSRDFPALIPAFRELKARGEAIVMCTIVETEGSTYRKAGARMLVDGSGNYYGVLGGGCFEGDLVERAGVAIDSGTPALVEYDMRGDEDLIWGLGLGCNGLVKLLLEPLSPTNGYQPLTYLAEGVQARREMVLATVFTGPRIGRSLALDTEGVTAIGLPPDEFPELTEACRQRLPGGRPDVTKLADGSSVLIDVIPRQHHLLIIGAGPDAVPMAKTAADLHWRVTIADHREVNPGAGHFPEGVIRVSSEPGHLADTVELADVSAALLMTHNFNADVGFLRSLALRPPAYVGLLGPTARRGKLIEELDDAQREALKDRIRGPVGLNIGGESPASIALAAIAEIHTCLEGADASSLDLSPSRSAA
ncbi:MAG: XdhC family protein [Chromatiales bacterium]|nr:XdhC family protein [Chromatiales bacterium]MDH4029599.1 XdhC family protein [Chromatiales bacterium]